MNSSITDQRAASPRLLVPSTETTSENLTAALTAVGAAQLVLMSIAERQAAALSSEAAVAWGPGAIDEGILARMTAMRTAGYQRPPGETAPPTA